MLQCTPAQLKMCWAPVTSQVTDADHGIMIVVSGKEAHGHTSVTH
jgi:hypothetical protein